MKLELGQVYRMIDRREGEPDRHVLVLDVRDEQNERGLGAGYGDCAQAWPIANVPWPATVWFEDLHPWDGWTLCDALPSHGDQRWALVPDVSYEVDSAEGKAVRR